MTGCDRYKLEGMTDVCFISAHDPKTGAELFKQYLVFQSGKQTAGNALCVFALPDPPRGSLQ